MPRAGLMRERVTVQSATVSADNIGGISDGAVTWASIATVPDIWARVMPISGRGAERVNAMQLQSAISHEVTIRYRTDLTPAYRLVWGSKALNIRSISHDEKHRHTTLFCEEGVAT